MPYVGGDEDPVRMAEHTWAAPQHQDVPVYAAALLPLDQIGVLEKLKAFAVARSDVAVYVEIAWQGRLQGAWVPRDTVTTRKLAPRRD